MAMVGQGQSTVSHCSYPSFYACMHLAPPNNSPFNGRYRVGRCV